MSDAATWAAQPDDAPVGVRAAVADAGGSARPLRWVRSGALVLAAGDLVAVHEAVCPDANADQTEWLGTVVIPAQRLLEWPATDVMAHWPVVARRAEPDEMPPPPVTDGHRLLASLGLRPALLQRPS